MRVKKEIVVKPNQNLITNYVTPNKKIDLIYEVDDIPLSYEPGMVFTFGKINSIKYTHGMYNYPAKFTPQIVEWAIKYTNTLPGRVVLDPFCGSGTTLVESRLRGLNSFGIDMNPIARLISKAKSTPLFPDNIKYLHDIIEKFIRYIKVSSFDINLDNDPLVNLHYNWRFWFEDDVMKKLIMIKKCIKNFQTELDDPESNDVRNFLFATLASVIKRTSYLNEQEIKVRKSLEKVRAGLPDPVPVFIERLRKNGDLMMKYTKQSMNHRDIVSKIIGTDARTIDLPNESIDLVITSPPYINAIDYPFAHKHELFILDLVDPDQYSDHSRNYIGVSERVLSKKTYNDLHITGFDFIDNIIKDIYNSGSNVDKNRAFIIYQYFTSMNKVFEEIQRVLRDKKYFVLFVGDNTIRGRYLPTHKFLLKIAEEVLGFKLKTYFYHQIKNRKLKVTRNITGGEINKEMAMVLQKI